MKLKIFIFVIITAAIIIITPFAGKKLVNGNRYTFSFSSFRDYNETVITDIRIPQTLMAFLAGFALSLCGLVYQTIFQNDLASPYTLGISSGTAFGAVISLKFNLWIFFSTPVIAFCSGFLTVIILILLASLKKVFDNFSLLLTGIALNFFFSAMILLTYYISDFGETFRIHRWLMGSIDEIGFSNVKITGIILIVITSILFLYRESLNLITLSDNIAHTRGLNIIQFKILMLVLTSIIIALTVSICGPIGFIGIICPHIAKLIFGYNHKHLIIMAGMLGGSFLALSFTFSRIIIFPSIIPVGIITSFIGGPFLIYLLYRKS